MNGNDIVSRDQCPRCRANGKDNSRDNLAIYEDGHEWCYACQFYKPSPIEKKLTTTITEPSNRAPGKLELPANISVNIPRDVESRLQSWGIYKKDCIKHNFMWDDQRQKLIMPVYDTFGQLIMYQERSWDIGQRKYLTFGPVSDILHILRPEERDESNHTIILTEDLISAIRVSEYVNAMPIWGSDIPLKTIQRLASRFEALGIWLDPDMKLKAVKDTLRASQYISAFFIDSQLDPKFYTLERIKEHINISGYSRLFKDRPERPSDRMSTQEMCGLDKTKICPSEHCRCWIDNDGVLHQIEEGK